MMKQMDLVVDLQFGSTGKGLLAGYLAKTGLHDTILTAWGPNAGHTYIDENGRKFVHTMLANGIVGPAVKRVMIGPGSVINLDSLLKEIVAAQDILARNLTSIYIHPHAAVVTESNRRVEDLTMTAIGSTKKGTGEAVIQKIRRDPMAQSVAKHHMDHPLFSLECVHLAWSSQEWAAIFDMGRRYLVEGAQGFGLSFHHGFYPFTTSRDVTPSQIIADCGIPWHIGRKAKVWGTARTYPIRVANRHNEHGEQVGYSGPAYEDQREIRWEDIGLEAELTTVTKLPRRIFTYSHQQMSMANDFCGPEAIFLNFVNYIQNVDNFISIYESIEQLGIRDLFYGFGPTVNNVIRSTNGGVIKDWDMLQGLMGK